MVSGKLAFSKFYLPHLQNRSVNTCSVHLTGLVWRSNKLSFMKILCGLWSNLQIQGLIFIEEKNKLWLNWLLSQIDKEMMCSMPPVGRRQKWKPLSVSWGNEYLDYEDCQGKRNRGADLRKAWKKKGTGLIANEMWWKKRWWKNLEHQWQKNPQLIEKHIQEILTVWKPVLDKLSWASKWQCPAGSLKD